MKKGLNEIVGIIDRSGSMDSIVDDAIGGLNTFIDEQKKGPGTANITIVLFDHKYKLDYENVPINEVKKYDNKSYVPRGTTALLDAIGRTVATVGERIANTPEDERPEKVIVFILTDGQENASVEYNKNKILEMITHQKDKYNWEFMYFAANQDDFAEQGKSLGISINNTVSFTSTGDGVRNAYNTVTKMSKGYRVS